MTTFLDTNALIYLLDTNHGHHSWSVAQLQNAKASSHVIIFDIVYCEFSVGMARQADVDVAVSLLGLERLRGEDAALFRAGVAYKLYKSRRGLKTNVSRIL